MCVEAAVSTSLLTAKAMDTATNGNLRRTSATFGVWAARVNKHRLRSPQGVWSYPWTKLVVPSTGSMIHVGLSVKMQACPLATDSSPMKL